MKSHLRVAINAQIAANAQAGGVESVLIGLVSALGKLLDGPEEYVIIGPSNNMEWIQPYIGPNQRLVRGIRTFNNHNQPAPKPKLLKTLERPFLWALRRRFGASNKQWAKVPVSTGFYESLKCAVIHFPTQMYIISSLPSIYNPHDLQHVHYPNFFKPPIIAWREMTYRAGCYFSHNVVVGSEWVKQDLMNHFQVEPNKIQVIPWAPPTVAYKEPSAKYLDVVREKYQLPQHFALYPAVTWEHKNHIRLLEALAYLRDNDNLVVPLVCTGTQHSAFWPKVEQAMMDMNLQDQVRFLGRVPPEDLRALYRLSQFVIVPTLFEAASGPVLEAWQDGAPVACSTVTSLPEQAGDAALLFDPMSSHAISAAVKKMACDGPFRRELIEKGFQRLNIFTWERTAKAYRAVYRRAAGQLLSEEDQELLRCNWATTHEKLENN